MKYAIKYGFPFNLMIFVLVSNLSAFTVTLTINISPSGTGTTSPSAGTHTYTYLKGGTLVNLDATPASDYKFVNWTGNVNDPNNASTYIILNSNETVTANFQALANYMVTVTTNQADKSWVKFVVDGSQYSNSRTETWQETSQHTLSVSSPQYALDASAKVSFQNWNKGWTTPSVTYEVPAYHDYVQANFLLYYEMNISENDITRGYAGAYPSHFDRLYLEGSVVSISAVAYWGYEFVGWEGDYTGSENPVDIIMNEPKNITAIFVPSMHNITVRTEPVQNTELRFFMNGSSCWGEVTGSFQTGTTVELITESLQEMSVPIRYYFQYWSYGSGSQSTSPEFDYAVSDHDDVITAHFSPEYGIASSIVPSGSGILDFEPINEGGYTPGTVVTITAIPKPGYTFTGWSGDTYSTDNPLVWTMNDYLLITANFSPIPDYTLTMAVNPSGGGTTQPSIGAHIYPAGSVVEIRAYPLSGYQFDHWDGNVENPASSSTTIIMYSDKTVIAQFKSVPTTAITMTTNFPEKSEVQYHVNSESWWGPHTFYWPPGSSQSLSADSIIGWGGMRYVFQSWSHGQPREHIYTVPSSVVTLTANFMDEYSLNLSVDPEGSGTIDLNPAGGWYGLNDEVILTANANQGYIFKNWLDGLTGSENPATLTMDYWKHVIAVFDTSITVVESEEVRIFNDFILMQNYPNPFNPTTTIRFDLPKSSFVTLKIYNLLGKEIATLVNGKRPAGEHAVEWNGKGLPNGIYLYHLRAGDFVETRKLILQK